MKKEQAVLMFFGLGGHHVSFKVSGGGQFDVNYTLSGYYKPDNFKINDNEKARNYEDCLVINKRNVLKNNPMLAISAPMMNVNLKDDDIDPCPNPSALMVWGLEGQFKTLANLKRSNKEYTGLDSISPKAYFEFWKSKGCQTGIIKNGQIIWD